MEFALDIATGVLLAGAGFFVIITGVGLLRLPDLYARLHAGGMTDTLAAALLVVGLALQSGLTLVTVKLIFILVFLFFTSPTAAYAIAHAALVAGLKPKLTAPNEETRSVLRSLGLSISDRSDKGHTHSWEKSS